MKSKPPDYIDTIRNVVANMKGPYDEKETKETKETISFLDNIFAKTQKLLADLRKDENKK